MYPSPSFSRVSVSKFSIVVAKWTGRYLHLCATAGPVSDIGRRPEWLGSYLPLHHTVTSDSIPSGPRASSCKGIVEELVAQSTGFPHRLGEGFRRY